MVNSRPALPRWGMLSITIPVSLSILIPYISGLTLPSNSITISLFLYKGHFISLIPVPVFNESVKSSIPFDLTAIFTVLKVLP
jgi:hypothetical protein